MHAAQSSGATWVDVAAAAAGGMAAWAGIAALLAIVVKTAVQNSIKGKVFTGTKWAAGQGAAARAFVRNLNRLLSNLELQLELPTVTRSARAARSLFNDCYCCHGLGNGYWPR